MGKNLDPKCKQCRRLGEKLMLKGDRCNSPKCAMVKRAYIPGFHGPKNIKARARKSDYSLQLAEKQKLKKQYILMEKQFKILFDKANKQTGSTGESLLKLLETRLDNTVYRLGFVPSRSEARQGVNHRLFTLNGKRVSIPSIQVKEGDVIALSEKSKRSKKFREIEERLTKANVPGWLNLDAKKATAKVLHEPSLKDINSNVDTQIIVEFYSK